VAVQVGAGPEYIRLAGEIVVERAGVCADSVIWRYGKADPEVAFPGAGGVGKGCVVGVAQLAVCYTGIIDIVFGVAAVCSGSGSSIWRSTVAFVAVIRRSKWRAFPCWCGGFEMTVYIRTGAGNRGRCLVEEDTFAVGCSTQFGRIIDIYYHVDTFVPVVCKIGVNVNAVAVTRVAVDSGGCSSHVSSVISLESAGGNIAIGGVQWTIICRGVRAVTLVALYLGDGCR